MKQNRAPLEPDELGAFVPATDKNRFRVMKSLKTLHDVETAKGLDLLSGTEVILKTTLSLGASRAAQARLEHEAAVLARIECAARPLVVHWGQDGGLVYLVRPFVPGPTLEERLSEGPLTVQESLRVASAILATLQRVHDLGVLHRDIKPANVVVEAQGGTVAGATLVDFGLARSERRGDSFAEQPAATARYVSPEQAGLLDRAIDERADLYSVGIILFECLTGRAPFLGDTVGELLFQHLTEKPPAVRTLACEVPQALDEVVQRLLQKDPRVRYGSAAGVLHDLAEIAAALEAGIAEPRMVVGTKDVRTTLAEPVFVGRENELKAFLDQLAAARRGAGGLCLLEAESGGGKTRLLDELARRCMQQGARVFRGQGVDQMAQRPFQVLTGVCRDLMSVAVGDVALREHLRGNLGEHAGAIGAALPKLSPLIDPPQASSGPEAHGEARILAGLSALIDALGSSDRPALVVLDDVQWADEPTLKLLALWQAQRERLTGASHVLVCVAFRSEAVGAGHPLRELRTALRLNLASLSAAELRSLLESMAGALPDEALAVVQQFASGSPFMASAVLHGMVECGALVPEAPGWRIEPSAMEDVRASRQAAAFLSRRIDLLPEPVKALLSVCALLGKTFEVQFAAGLAKQDLAEALRHLRQARDRHIVWPGADSSRWVFVHDKLRETLLGRLAPSERIRLHRWVAQRLEASETARDFDIAYHFDAACEPGLALPYALRAAASARAQLSLEVAERQYRIASHGAVTVRDRGTVSEGLGDVLMLRGRYDEAQEEFETARSLAEHQIDRARIDGKLGELAFKRGEVRTATECLERALRSLGRWVPTAPPLLALFLVCEVAAQALHSALPRLFLGRRRVEGAESELLAIRLYSKLTYAYWFHRGKIACAWAHLREMNLAERYPPTAELAQAYSEHAPVMTMIPWFRRGIVYAEKSLAIRTALGDLWGQGQSLHFYGVVLYAASRYAECIDKCRQAMRLLERTGDRWEMNTAHWHIALCLYRQGALREAVAMARAVHAVGLELGDHQAVGIGLGIWAKASRGDVPIAVLDQELLRPNDDVHTVAEVLQAAALRALAEHKPTEAAGTLRKAQRLIDDKGLRQEYVAAVRPWLTTALRQAAEAVPVLALRNRKKALRAARVQAAKALASAHIYQNNLPHALREQALVAALDGRERLAKRSLEQSLAVAERQGARFEHAQSLLVRGQIGVALDWPAAATDVERGREALSALGVGSALEPEPPSGSREPATLSLADRFSTLLEVGRHITSALSRDDIQDAVQKAGLALLRGEQCHVLEVGAVPGGDGPATAAIAGDLAEGQLSRAMVQRALATGRPTTSDEEMAEDTRESLALAGVRSALCAPILVRGEPTQCLYVISGQVSGLFGKDDRRLAEFIATLAGAALERSEGFVRLRNLSESLETRSRELDAANGELSTSLDSLKHAQRKLLHAERMAAVGTLAAGVAHEINNPLAYVIGNLDFIAETWATFGQVCGKHIECGGTCDPATTELRREVTVALQGTRSGALRVRDIVRDLNTFSRVGEEQVTPVDVVLALDASIAMCLNEVRYRARLTRDFQPVPYVRANESRLGQVFLNLLINAAHAIPEGRADQNEISVSTRMAANGRVEVAVRDTGVGIAPDVLPRIFDPFFTTKPVGVGTGLGLSICHGIVTGFDGEITVESKLGEGTVFRVQLPAAREPETTTAPVPTAVIVERRGQVLVIDDEPMVASVVKRSLRSQQDVLTMTRARDALEHLSSGAQVDAIICDLMMPEMTGMEFHAELVQRHPRLAERVIFLTGGAFTPRAEAFLRDVLNPRLDKPFDARVLRELVRSVIEGKGPADPG